MTRSRKIRYAGITLVAAALLALWWSSGPAPLTAEEEYYVGTWGEPTPKPGYNTEVTFRPDRTAIIRTWDGKSRVAYPDQEFDEWAVENNRMLLRRQIGPRRYYKEGYGYNNLTELGRRHEAVLLIEQTGPDSHESRVAELNGKPIAPPSKAYSLARKYLNHP